MRSSRFVLPVLVAAAAGCAVMASPALAVRTSSLSTGTITNVELAGQSLVLHGQLSAQDWQCLARRTVVLSRPGPREVARGTTDAAGYWTITVRGWSTLKKMSFWAWATSTGRRGALLCEGGGATRTVLYLPAVTRQYTQILSSARSILADTDRLIRLGAGRNMGGALGDEAKAAGLIYRAEHDVSIFAARADAARARWFAAIARSRAAAVLGL